MAAAIVKNRVAGTRITVWDVLHYLEGGEWSHEQIADVLSLTVEQVQAAVDYIEKHHDEVMKVHRQIEERNARGNPPEVEAKLKETRARMRKWLKEQRSKKRETIRVGHPGGR